MQAYDTLVTTGLICLGRKFGEVEDTLDWLQWRRVKVRCVELDPTAVLADVDPYGSGSVPTAVQWVGKSGP
jgi:hypothetical protein